MGRKQTTIMEKMWEAWKTTSGNQKMGDASQQMPNQEKEKNIVGAINQAEERWLSFIKLHQLSFWKKSANLIWKRRGRRQKGFECSGKWQPGADAQEVIN